MWLLYPKLLNHILNSNYLYQSTFGYKPDTIVPIIWRLARYEPGAPTTIQTYDLIDELLTKFGQNKHLIGQAASDMDVKTITTW